MSAARISADAERPSARRVAVLRRRSSVLLGVAAVVLVTVSVLTVIDRRRSERGETGRGGSDGELVAQPQLIANTWRALPIAPIAERKSYAATWALSDMLVWGGIANDQSHAPLDDGAAYSPATNSWRVLPKSPLGPRSGSLSVWSGSEWFVLGGADRGNRLVDGAAYNPVTNRWRKIADLPFRVAGSSRAAWTGVGIVLWDGRDGQTAVYEPSANRWHIGANSPEPPALFGDAVQIGVEFVTVGKSGLSFTIQAYNWMTNSWRTIASPPWDGPFGNAVVANAGNELFIGGGGGRTGGNR